MAEAAVTFLHQQLTEVVIGYRDLISGAEAEFEKLNSDLDLLKAFLKATAEKKMDPLLSEVKNRIMKVAYEVEKSIDTCLTKAMEVKVKAKTSRKQTSLSSSSRHFSLAKEVQSIRDDKVRPLLDDVNNFAGMQKIADRYEGVESQRDTPIKRKRVVGFDEEERKIIYYINDQTDELNVISIVGIPGQGKTTLAWKVYWNDLIGYDFPIRIWVNISQTFKMRDVLLEILKKFSPSQDASSLDDNELARMVRSCLEKEKFLLVLDDVWSVEAWRKIKQVLPENNWQGKVLITTRQRDVGMQSRVHHSLRFLDEDESWELLQYEVFNKLDVCPRELEAIGNQIAIKCDGVPLTIVVIGGILADQHSNSPSTSVDDWRMVSKNVSETLQNGNERLISDVVELSYRRLSDDLKECFVFLGVFPEDYVIPTKMLCGLWISEGFILPKYGRSLKQSAEDNMNDLIRRNLLIADKTNEMGLVKTCRVHDIIREYCIKISKTKNLYQEVKGSETGEFEPVLSEVKNSHRLSVCSHLSAFLSESPNGPHVRSFLCFDEQPVEKPEYMSAIVDGFPRLRILDFKCIKFNSFPAKFVRLIHLRYLTLYVRTLTILPEPITQLWNLQSLIVETESHSITMKANMWRMIRLTYLKTKAAIVLDSKWVDDGEAGDSLHTLSRLSPDSCTEALSRRARNLKALGISGKLSNIFESKFLQNLRLLEKLKLVNTLAYEATSEDFLPGFPHWNFFPPNLKRLTLMKTHVSWQNMSTLAMIRSLQVLKLRDDAFVGVSWNLGPDIFPNLQLLHISNLSELVLWEAPEGAFPKLKFLLVKNCENLKEIPESVGTHLEKLEIDRVRSSAVKSAQRIEKSKTPMPDGKFNLIIGPTCGAM